MAIGDIIVGIDISYSKVSLSMGEINRFGQIDIMAQTKKNCNPYDSGELNEAVLIPALEEILDEAEDMTNMNIDSAYVTIPGEYTNVIHTEIKKDTKDNNAGVTLQDVLMTILEGATLDIPIDQTTIEIIPSKFKLDNNVITEDPIGKKSSTLTLLPQVITASSQYVAKVQSIFKKVDLDIDQFTPISVIDREFVLEPSELKQNILIIDVGSKRTEIGIFVDGVLLYTDSFMVGGDSITNDIAYILGISLEEAELLKRTYGLALKSYIENDNSIQLTTTIDDNKDSKIKISEVVDIIENSTSDIFMKINKSLKKVGLKDYIDNVVMTGQGIVNIAKSDVVCKVELSRPVKFATNKNLLLTDKDYHKSYALIKYFANRPFAKSVKSNVSVREDESKIQKIINKIKDFFYS